MTLRIVEGVSGYWSYHLAKPDQYVAICGNGGPMMNTEIPREQWGVTCANEDINYKWCDACLKLTK